jgi:exodeoxyribonuclease-5
MIDAKDSRLVEYLREMTVEHLRRGEVAPERLRELKGFSAAFPQAGDKLVCLRNNHDRGLLNGSIWFVVSVNDVTEDKIEMTIRSEDDPPQTLEVTSWSHAFFGQETDLPWFERKDAEEFDYGYVLTCHKSQGSQFKNVVLFDESYIARAHRARWLYTGITRAEHSVKVVRMAS